MPLAARRSPHVPALAATPGHLFGRARGLVPPSTFPHTHSEGGGRREPRPRTHSLRAPPPAVPDISRGSLSPLLGGKEGDDTRPATFALLGSRRSGSLPLAGAAGCRPDYSRQPRRQRLRRRRRRQRRAQRALPPARSAPPCSAFRPRPADGAAATQGSPRADVAAAAPASGKGGARGGRAGRGYGDVRTWGLAAECTPRPSAKGSGKSGLL